MNAIGELLRVEDIRLDLEVRTRFSCSKSRCAARGAARTFQGANPESLKVRENWARRGSVTDSPSHARMSQCATATAALVRTKFAIPFDAPDGRPVSVFLGLIVPHKANEAHLQLLATAAGMFSDRGLRDKLRTGSDPSTLREIIAAWPDPLAAPGIAAL
jgi:PTS system nitrogen regulatory IIA component